jgi:hypothetical protein
MLSSKGRRCVGRIHSALFNKVLLKNLIENLPVNVTISEIQRYDSNQNIDIIFESAQFKKTKFNDNLPEVDIKVFNYTVDFSSVWENNSKSTSANTTTTWQGYMYTSDDDFGEFEAYVDEVDDCQHEWTYYHSMLGPSLNFEYCKKCGEKSRLWKESK